MMRSGAVRLRWLAALCLCSMLTLASAGCGSDEGSSEGGGSGAAGGEQDTFQVGLALPGPKSDQGFSQTFYEGLQQAESEFGVKINVVESLTNPQSRVDGLRNLAANSDLIIGAGAEFAQPAKQVAPQFPDTDFSIVFGEAAEGVDNLHVYGIRIGIPAYLAGVLAAEMSKSGKVGFLGGEKIPTTVLSDDGFHAGADSQGEVEYVSTTVGSFDDAGKAKEAASAQLASGADVIFAMIDSGLPGVFQAAATNPDAKVFNIVTPQCDKSEQSVGAAIASYDHLVVQMVRDFQDEAIPAQPKFYGVEDPEIQRLELCPGFDSPALQKLLDDTSAGIEDGTIKLPEGV